MTDRPRPMWCMVSLIASARDRAFVAV